MHQVNIFQLLLLPAVHRLLVILKKEEENSIKEFFPPLVESVVCDFGSASSHIFLLLLAQP